MFNGSKCHVLSMSKLLHDMLKKVLLYDKGNKRYSSEKDIKMTLRSLTFKVGESGTRVLPATLVIERSLSFKNWQPSEEIKPESTALYFKNKTADNCEQEFTNFKNMVVGTSPVNIPYSSPEFSSPRPLSELDAAAVKLQKVYKSYRTRRNLADCAVVIEELWWKALDYASLKHSSISYFDVKKPQTAISRWARALTRVAKVGKGLSKDEKAQKLALRHWLEAIDPRHRYGHNLHLYYDVWFTSESTQPFFYWLDVGDGRELNLEMCPRSKLLQQCIQYLGPKERKEYEVVVRNGKLMYRQSEVFVNTDDESKWIFVLSTARTLYVGQKRKGTFQHSSFLAGGATTAAGRLVAKEGVLQAIWPYSGHYLPTEENFLEFISYLEDNSVDLTNVKRYSVDDDEKPSVKQHGTETLEEEAKLIEAVRQATMADAKVYEKSLMDHPLSNDLKSKDYQNAASFKLARHRSCTWSTGNGPRIGCVRDYPADLQCKALEHVNLSPKVSSSPAGNKIPIPSPRPSPKFRVSPRLVYMGIPSPTVSLTLPDLENPKLD
ncbi:hypothetical protein HPP92_009145 [Vanilla planifolia]|uniref:IQ domain-containing protein IQM1-like n=1 Tax=Vanilla planifolia TaxID=51239 RepID=A0A835V6N9_VANPL|nr:hypothetical protein HPP92_009145 [Vanilla planifolia]